MYLFSFKIIPLITRVRGIPEAAKNTNWIENCSNKYPFKKEEANTQTNLKNALTKFGNERYKNLEDKINSYFTVVSYIEKYQNLQKENVSLENQYSSLSNRLYYTETYTTTSTASDGTVSTETHTRRVKDRWVESQMSNVRKKINDNKEEMENLKNRVSNSI